ncbi:hypothetical protein DB313_04700 (plasmid) [Borrelia turcica IST7]|uniref:Uncharacterized protein n=1 Tax=Borrelia turcica IST7 TaxID=1104446 RepID=A0A386PMJ3_9SPIR|nr:hypothetical protein [Borrelia turcica]AYE36801.1 hypothetical protein DB313_04700 [Borrelia turcica IST7]
MNLVNLISMQLIKTYVYSHTVVPNYLDDIAAKRDEEANRKVLADVLDKLRKDLKVDYKITDKSDNSTTLRED